MQFKFYLFGVTRVEWLLGIWDLQKKNRIKLTPLFSLVGGWAALAAGADGVGAAAACRIDYFI